MKSEVAPTMIRQFKIYQNICSTSTYKFHFHYFHVAYSAISACNNIKSYGWKCSSSAFIRWKFRLLLHSRMASDSSWLRTWSFLIILSFKIPINFSNELREIVQLRNCKFANWFPGFAHKTLRCTAERGFSVPPASLRHFWIAESESLICSDLAKVMAWIFNYNFYV